MAVMIRMLFLVIINLDRIYCVRWGPNGDTIASASEDKTAKLLDWKTGKVILQKETSDKSNFIIVNFSTLNGLGQPMSVCFI